MLGDFLCVNAMACKHLCGSRGCQDSITKLRQPSNWKQQLRLISVGNRNEDGSADWQSGPGASLALCKGSGEIGIDTHYLAG